MRSGEDLANVRDIATDDGVPRGVLRAIGNGDVQRHGDRHGPRRDSAFVPGDRIFECDAEPRVSTDRRGTHEVGLRVWFGMSNVFARNHRSEKPYLVRDEVCGGSIRHCHDHLRNTRGMDAVDQFERTLTPRDLLGNHRIDLVHHALNDDVNGKCHAVTLHFGRGEGQTAPHECQAVGFSPTPAEFLNHALFGQQPVGLGVDNRPVKVPQHGLGIRRTHVVESRRVYCWTRAESSSMTVFSVKSGRPLIVAFEGWNDAGDAATSAVRAVIERYNLDSTFSIDTEVFYDYQQVRPTIEFIPDEGRRINWPTASFFAPTDISTNVHALMGTEPSRSWPTFAATFLDEALAADITGVIVLGAALAEVPHTRPIEVGRTSDNAQVREQFDCERSQYEGHIGITTVVAQFAEQVGIPTLSLWAGVPHYALHSPSPKVTYALLAELNEIAELDIDLTEFEAQAKEWEETVDEIAEGDEDMTDYIQRLEEERDNTTGPLASGDAIAAEFEEFLRSNDDGSQNP